MKTRVDVAPGCRGPIRLASGLRAPSIARPIAMKIITAEEVHAALSYPDLVDELQRGFAGEFTMPPRQVFLLDDKDDNNDAFAVLPSWNDSIIGVKAFTYFPDNPRQRGSRTTGFGPQS